MKIWLSLQIYIHQVFVLDATEPSFEVGRLWNVVFHAKYARNAHHLLTATPALRFQTHAWRNIFTRFMYPAFMLKYLVVSCGWLTLSIFRIILISQFSFSIKPTVISVHIIIHNSKCSQEQRFQVLPRSTHFWPHFHLLCAMSRWSGQLLSDQSTTLRLRKI